MIGLMPAEVTTILSELQDMEALELYVAWQEQIYREQCAKYVDEVIG